MDEPLGLLLLPSALENFELAEHARGLLQIPRVVALEPGRVRTPSFIRDAAAVRQAKRLKLPGVPRLVVLYHPIQYPLARALCAGGRFPLLQTDQIRKELAGNGYVDNMDGLYTVTPKGERTLHPIGDLGSDEDQVLEAPAHPRLPLNGSGKPPQVIMEECEDCQDEVD